MWLVFCTTSWGGDKYPILIFKICLLSMALCLKFVLRNKKCRLGKTSCTRYMYNPFTLNDWQVCYFKNGYWCFYFIFYNFFLYSCKAHSTNIVFLFLQGLSRLTRLRSLNLASNRIEKIGKFLHLCEWCIITAFFSLLFSPLLCFDIFLNGPSFEIPKPRSLLASCRAVRAYVIPIYVRLSGCLFVVRPGGRPAVRTQCKC